MSFQVWFDKFLKVEEGAGDHEVTRAEDLGAVVGAPLALFLRQGLRRSHQEDHRLHHQGLRHP